MSSCVIEDKGVPPEGESDENCEVEDQVVVGGAFYRTGPSVIYTSYRTMDWANDNTSSSWQGFRLVKDFELRAEPEEKKKGNVAE